MPCSMRSAKLKRRPNSRRRREIEGQGPVIPGHATSRGFEITSLAYLSYFAGAGTVVAATLPVGTMASAVLVLVATPPAKRSCIDLAFSSATGTLEVSV